MSFRAPRGASLALFGMVAVAAALRLPGLATDFWLDEIWTLNMIEQRTDSLFDVFTSIRHSNNHHLNTLYFYLLGEQENWSLYRLHSFVAGVASVWLAFRIGARAARLEALFAAGLCATSYLLIHYSSEARGYAMVVLFSLAAFDVLQLDRTKQRPLHAALFGLYACLGFLSHLMFLHTFIASFVWMAAVQLRQNGLARAARRMLELFGPATLFLLWFYFVDIRQARIGDGPELDLSGVVVKALSHAFGGPSTGPVAAAAATATAACWLASIAWLARQKRDEWIFYATLIVASPAISFLLLRPELFFVRYFLLSTVFGFIALAHPLAAAWRFGGTARAAVAGLLALALLGNATLTARFYRHGRGAYLETMRFIAESTPDVIPTVAGDHRFRTGTVVRFYNRYLPPNQQLVLVEQQQYPEWLLLHRIGELGEIDQALADGAGHKYELARTVPYAGLSGWHWILYRRIR